MSRIDGQGWGWLVLTPGVLFLLGLSTPSAAAQAPVVVPGSPVSNLQAGATPGTTVEMYSGRSEAPTSAATSPDAGGAWLDLRDDLFDEGVDLHTNISQFYQGTAAGGLRQGFAYGLKFDYFATIEAEKLLGWKGLFVNLHGESRFGPSVNRDVGSLVPANFALEFPRPTGGFSALTNMQVEQFIGRDLVVTFGKLNAADGVNIHPFLGGNGVNRFMNEAFVLSPIYGHTIPYSTPGAGFSYLRENDPVFTLLVLDSSGRPDTSGLSRPFRNGTTLFAHLRAPVTPFGLPGHQSLELAFATGEFSPFTEDDYVILPSPANRSPRRTGERVISYGFDQFLIVDAETPGRGWGVFGNASLANQQTNPIHWLLNVGLSGQSPIPGRVGDSFGAAYYYLAPSDVLREALRTVSPIRSREQGFEVFYNAAITRWFVLTADLQAIEPAQLDARSCFLFALRARIDF